MSPRNGALFLCFSAHSCMEISDHAPMVLYNDLYKKVDFIKPYIMVRVPSGAGEQGDFVRKYNKIGSFFTFSVKIMSIYQHVQAQIFLFCIKFCIKKLSILGQLPFLYQRVLLFAIVIQVIQGH